MGDIVGVSPGWYSRLLVGFKWVAMLRMTSLRRIVGGFVMFGRVCQKGCRLLWCFQILVKWCVICCSVLCLGDCFILCLLCLLARAGGGVSVRLNLIGLVETSCGMVWCFSVR